MLKGTLDDFTLPDVFRLMYLARKTGKLEVERSAGNGKVFIRDGDVYYAESSLAREPLGQKLIRSGALTEGALMKALDENAATGQRVGEILIAQSAVTVEQLQRAVQQQIEDSVFDLMRWEAGSFEWQSGVVADVEVPIAISVENLIMEASRRLDELEVISRKIPSEDAVLAMSSTPPAGAVEINIQPEEWRMLVLVNGSRTVREIGEMTGTDDFSAMRSLYGLVSAGLVDVVDTGTESDEAAPSESVGGFDRPIAPAPEVDGSDSPALEALKAAGFSPDVSDDMVGSSNGSVAEETPVEEPPAEPLEEVDVADQMVEASAAAQVEEIEEDTAEAPAAVEETPEESPYPAVEETPEGSTNDDAVFEGFGLEFDEGSIDSALEAPIEGFDAPTGADDTSDLSDLNDLSDLVSAGTNEEPEAWNEIPVDSFDEPGPDDLVTRTAEADDPFLNELFETSTPPAAPPAAEVEEAIPAPPEPALDDEVPMEPPAPAPAAPAPAAETPSESEPEGQVDRAAVVRELAGLFSDEDRPRPRTQAAKAAADAEEEDVRKRVEDDDAINKGLIGRLIDGVKGL